MKFAILALFAMLSTPAHAAQVRLFALINVDETSTLVSRDANGSTTVDRYDTEKTYYIGWNDSLRQQIVAKIGGCSLLSLKTIKLMISDAPSAYAGFLSKTTYNMSLTNNAECKEVQKLLSRVTYESPVIVDIDASSKTFTIRQ